MKNYENSERGQAIVLLVVSLVVLLGFTALALDGGMVLSNRRNAQNAADAAALAGGGMAASAIKEGKITYATWNLCTDTLLNAAKQAAINQAAKYSYTIEATTPSDLDTTRHGVTAVCHPTIGETDIYSRYVEVRVMITEDTPTSFAHLLFGGPLQSTVEAVTQFTPDEPLFGGNVIVSLSDTCPNQNQGGITFDGGGSSEININGGGIFSNSCLTGNGGVYVDVNNGEINYYTEYNPPPPSSGWIGPEPEQVTQPFVDPNYPPPDCSSFDTYSTSPSNNNNQTIGPGKYTSISRTGGDLVMSAGLYCVDSGFSINGGTVTGDGVTIYMRGGDFGVGSNSTAILSAPSYEDCGTNGCAPAVTGLLIYMLHNGNITLGGTATSEYVGTVYAPSGTIDVGGTGSLISELFTQIIGWTVKVHGNTTMNITYNLDENLSFPAKLDLYK
jgi:hypothetical protein